MTSNLSQSQSQIARAADSRTLAFNKQTSDFRPQTSDCNSQTSDLNAAYDYCRRTTRHHAKSFYFCAQFLKREKRRAIYAVYALCRHIDDEVDEAAVRDE